MSDAFDKISKVWTEFPLEYKNSILYDDVNELKTAFENKKDYFGDYFTKIVIIGNVSTGKSTLINVLLGKEYFETITGDGTAAFFYCSLSKKNYEYFTVNNCLIERKEIETLKYASRSNYNFRDYFDQNSVIKVYVKRDENKILDKQTVIVDCPGFGYDENYDKAINIHCSNADMFIFMFDINEPATLKQRNFIIKKTDTEMKPACLFVYNKCDSIGFNENMKISLRDNFSDLFGQHINNLMLNTDPLYFISAKSPDKYEDLSRLKKDIMIYTNKKFLQHVNNQSKLSDEINLFQEKLNYFISKEEAKISSLKGINERRDHILEYFKRHIDHCKNDLLLDKIFELIRKEIFENKEKCNKKTASKMICKIKKNIKKLVNEFVEKNLQTLCIDPINKKLHDIKNDTNGTIIIDDIRLKNTKQHLIIPTFREIKDMFKWFEFGDKTKEAKEYFDKFIQSKTCKTQIIESIKNLYNSEFSNIQMSIEDFLDNSSSGNIKLLEKNLEPLLDYKKCVYVNVKKYNESCF